MNSQHTPVEALEHSAPKTPPKFKEPILIGSTLPYVKDVEELLQRMHRQCGEVCQSNLFFHKSYTLLGPDANELLLLNRDQTFSSQLAWETLLDPLFKNGLMLKDGEEHRYHRRLINSAFSREALESYMSITNEQVAQSVKTWPDDRQISFLDSIKRLTLDLATRIFMGVNTGNKANEINQWFIELVDASCVPLKLPFYGTKYGKGLRARRRLIAYFSSLVPDRRHHPGSDMLTRLAQAQDEEGKSYTDIEVSEQMVFLMMAAHDTTTSALTSLVYFLAKEPDWQQRLRDEILEIDTSSLDYERLPELSLCGAAFKEALRMKPPLAVIPRVATRDFVYRGYRIPKDELIQVCPIFTHYMPEIWREPSKFDPERFLPPRQEDLKHRYAYIPFGGGAHKCLGMHFAENQAKIILFHLLKKYQIEVDDAYSPIWKKVPIIHPQDGLPVHLSLFAESQQA